MTVKELNAIRSAAFEAFKSQHKDDWNTLFNGNGVCYVVDVTEGSKREIWTVQHLTQINKQTLTEHGFTENAKSDVLYRVNRQTKQMF